MKLVAFDIPEDDAQLGPWIEGQLVGRDLGDLVAQLLTTNDHADAPTVDALLGDRLPEVLRSGLGEFSADELRGLLTCPSALLELQERVFVEGGPYWDSVPRAPEQAAAADRVAASVAPRLSETARANEPVSPGTAAATESVTRRRVLWAIPAIAATLLIGVSVWDFNQAPRPEEAPSVNADSAWGFARIESLGDDLTAPEYLRQLASLAGEWSNKTPDTDAALSKRLDRFREGCDALLAAEHAPLAERDRKWLIGRCRSWRAQIVKLRDLADAGDAFDQVHADADTLVAKIAARLGRRADEVG